MKSKTKIVAGIAALLTIAPMYLAGLHAQREVSPDPDSKPSQDQSGIQLALPKGKKLILTDGSFQIAREYSVDGERVRYWSVERSQWEEIPASLVDWDATHKGEAEQASRDAALKAKIHASDVAERTRDINVDLSVEIKPGLFLPDGVGFYALETKQLYEMKQSRAEAHISKTREAERILSGVSLIPKKQTLEIPDTHAALRLDTAEPEFFMRPADGREPRFRLLHAQIKGGHRLLENVTTHFTGDETRDAKDIIFETWTPAHGVFRYTISQRLEPGEYAFVEMTEEGTNPYIWDFGIDLPNSKSKK